MPSASQCELSSVYVRYSDTANRGGIAEESIRDHESFDLCLKLEAGLSVFNAGAVYKLFVVVNDLSDSCTTVYNSSRTGSLGDPKWPTMNITFSWTIPAGSIPVASEHIYQATALMRVGKNDPIVRSAQSVPFTFTKL